jgi:hypothetical protein
MEEISKEKALHNYHIGCSIPVLKREPPFFQKKIDPRGTSAVIRCRTPIHIPAAPFGLAAEAF